MKISKFFFSFSRYNKAPQAGAASCENCVVVAFGNTNSRNTGKGADMCDIGQ